MSAEKFNNKIPHSLRTCTLARLQRRSVFYNHQYQTPAASFRKDWKRRHVFVGNRKIRGGMYHQNTQTFSVCRNTVCTWLCPTISISLWWWMKIIPTPLVETSYMASLRKRRKNHKMNKCNILPTNAVVYRMLLVNSNQPLQNLPMKNKSHLVGKVVFHDRIIRNQEEI